MFIENCFKNSEDIKRIVKKETSHVHTWKECSMFKLLYKAIIIQVKMPRNSFENLKKKF